jgi:hypothetical protein
MELTRINATTLAKQRATRLPPRSECPFPLTQMNQHAAQVGVGGKNGGTLP